MTDHEDRLFTPLPPAPAPPPPPGLPRTPGPTAPTAPWAPPATAAPGPGPGSAPTPPPPGAPAVPDPRAIGTIGTSESAATVQIEEVAQPVEPVEPDVGRSTSRRHLVLPIVAGLVLLVGIGVAVAGLVAKANAEQDADDAARELVTVTETRDDTLTARNTAVGEAATASSELATVRAEAQRVASIATGAATTADQFTVCDQRLTDAMNEAIAAVQAQDFARAEQAGQAMQAAITDCNATTDAYDAAITSFYTDGGPGTATA